MSLPNEPTRDRELASLARALDALGPRRRRLVLELAAIEEERRRLTRLLQQLMQPDLPVVPDHGLLPGDATPNGGGSPEVPA